jgi:hypothetical protein
VSKALPVPGFSFWFVLLPDCKSKTSLD